MPSTGFSRAIANSALPSKGPTMYWPSISGGRGLSEHGEGIHHVSLGSNDLDADCDDFQQRGVRIVGKAESGDIKVAFTHPKNTFGVLFEIAAQHDSIYL